MTVAFSDAVIIRNLLSNAQVPNLVNSKLILSKMSVLHWKRKDLSSVVNILAQALYDLFSAGDGMSAHFFLLLLLIYIYIYVCV